MKYEPFNVTSIGYNHLKENKLCQDHSYKYISNDKVIIAVCDGHGGDIYLRSDKGSKYACLAFAKTMKSLSKNINIYDINESFVEQLIIKLLCNWNELIESDFNNNLYVKNYKKFKIDYYLSSNELDKLSEEMKERITKRKSILYGTTLIGCMVINNMLFTIQIGDGLAVYLNNSNELVVPFIDSDDNVANLTCSLCQDDAFDYLHIDIREVDDIQSIILCTDGVINSYNSYENYLNYFILPITNILSNDPQGRTKVRKFIHNLGKQKGTGDDVSLGVLYINETKKSFV